MSEPTKRAHDEMEQALHPTSAPPLLRCADGTMPCPSELLKISCSSFISSCMECDDFNGTINVSKFTQEEVMDFIQLYLCSERKHRKTNTDDAYILRLCRAARVGVYLSIAFSWRPLAKVCTNMCLINGDNDSPVVRAFMALFAHESTWRAFVSYLEPDAILKWIANVTNDISLRFLTSKVTDFLTIPSDTSSWFPDDVHFQKQVQQSPAIHFLSLILSKPDIVSTRKQHDWLQKLLHDWIHEFRYHWLQDMRGTVDGTTTTTTAEHVRDFFDTDEWSIDPALRDAFIQFVLEHTLKVEKAQYADVKSIQELVKNVSLSKYFHMERPTVLHELNCFKVCVIAKDPYQLPETFGRGWKWKEVIERHEAELKDKYTLHSTIPPIQGSYLLKLLSTQMTVFHLLVKLRCEVPDLAPIVRYLKQQGHVSLPKCFIDKQGDREYAMIHDEFHPHLPPIRLLM
jgi:hypothetical protein